MKIQINTKEGLYELIASDKNLEIEIKKRIINEYAKDYIKSVANSEIINDLKTQVVKELKKTNYCGVLGEYSLSGSPNLSVNIKELIHNEVKQCVNNEILTQVVETKLELLKKTREEIKETLATYDEEKIRSLVKEILDTTIKKLLKNI